MAADYDFDSMIDSGGAVTEEFIHARLLAMLIKCLNPFLAKAVPVSPDDIEIRGNDQLSLGGCLQMDCGRLIGINNLTGEEQTGELHHNGFKVPIALSSHYTALFPLDLDLSFFGGLGILSLCNQELSSINKRDEKLLVRTYGSGDLELVFCDRNIKIPLRVGQGGKVQQGPLCFIPALPEETGLLIDPPGFSLDSQTEYTSLCILGAMAHIPEPPYRETPVAPLEVLGQYRGVGSYRVELDEDAQVLVQNMADLIYLKRNNVPEGFYFGDGSSRIFDWSAGVYTLDCEIWGHSNFDHYSCPSLQMGSLKGITGLTVLKGEFDITRNWILKLSNGNLQDTAVSDIDGYISVHSPFIGEYHRIILPPRNYDSFFLYIEKPQGGAGEIFVDQRPVGKILIGECFTDLTDFLKPGGEAELVLRITRRVSGDPLGKIKFYYGTRLKTCEYGPVQYDAIFGDPFEEIKLPLPVKPEKPILLQLKPDIKKGRDIKVFFKGMFLRIDVLVDREVYARLLLGGEGLPPVMGGDPEALYLPGQYLENHNLTIFCRAVGTEGLLSSINIKSYCNLY
jgi:hypothetical protein